MWHVDACQRLELSIYIRVLVQTCRWLRTGGGVEEEYEEQGDEDEDEEGYVTDDSVDPDNMTYEARPCARHDHLLGWLQQFGRCCGGVSCFSASIWRMRHPVHETLHVRLICEEVFEQG